MKAVRLFLFATALGLYTTFVFQALWNWFLAPAFGTPSVGYWQMFGVNMLLHLLLERNAVDDENRWKRAFLLLYASVPPDRKEEIDHEIASEDENIWSEAGRMVFTKLATNTATLVIGWAIHGILA